MTPARLPNGPLSTVVSASGSEAGPSRQRLAGAGTTVVPGESSSPFAPVSTPSSSSDISAAGLTPLPDNHHARNQLQHQLHNPPNIPSTFLPSYYPESRFPPSSSSSPFNPSLPELAEGSRHTLSYWERMSRAGPSSHDLLDGVKLPSPSPTPPLWPVAGAGAGSNGGTPMMELAGLPHLRNPPYPTASGGGGSSSTNTSVGWMNRNQGQMNWSSQSQAGPSSTPASTHSHQPSRSPLSSSPAAHHRTISNASASPHASHLVPPPPQPQSQAASHLSPRFHPYSKPRVGSSSASPALAHTSGGHSGTMGPPPQPSSLGIGERGWSEPAIQDPVPQSAGYPGIMYANVPLPEGYNASLPYGGRSVDEPRVGQEEYTQALAIYNHLLSALPHIVSNTAPPPDAPVYPGTRQSFDSLVTLASDGLGLLSGQIPGDGAKARGKRRNSGSNGNGGGGGPMADSLGVDSAAHGIGTSGGVGVGGGGAQANEKKSTTKCLGCGATETPEWRRGPMGPRTLCNACGLVHMKLQRKKKKAEEKARAAAAAAGGGPDPGSTGTGTSTRK